MELPVITVATALWIVAEREYKKYGSVRNARKRRSVGLSTIVLTPEGLAVSNNRGKGNLGWNRIVEITESSTLILMFVGPIKASIIPKRAFTNKEHAEQFISTARAYWSASRDGTSQTIGNTATNASTELKNTFNEICYQLKATDLLEQHDVIKRENPESAWSLMSTYAGAPLSIGLFYLTIESVTPLNLAVVLLFTASWAALVHWRIESRPRRIANRAVGRPAKCTVILDRDRMHFNAPLREILIKWINVYDIIESKNVFVFRLNKTSGITVPKRAFSGQDHAQQFISTAHDYWSAARDGTSQAIGNIATTGTSKLSSPGVPNEETPDLMGESARTLIHHKTEMEICYQANRTDFLDIEDVIKRENPRFPWRLILEYAWAPLIIGFKYYAITFVLPMNGSTALFLIALSTVFVYWQHKSIVRNRADKWAAPPSKRTVMLNRDHLRYEEPSGEMLIKWKNIYDIIESKNICVIRLNKVSGVVVPKRAFSGPDHMQQFIETARAYWNAARDGTEPVLPEPLDMWPPPPQSSST